ncbi:MAG: hypothetical protein H0W51_08095 [Euzebyales bacterium]|nr:hypothetical protein [Euzebyales bacterium]MDQ3343605.1 hypothetical protein [Actinomycetota bacterium]
MTAALRLTVAVVIMALLSRSARLAWSNRGVAIAVWRRVRIRHMLGSLALLVVVGGAAVGLAALVPVTGYGLGTLVGFTGNAVFAPVEEVAVRAGGVSPLTSPAAGVAMTAVVCAFVLGLAVLFPWLAYVEEQRFRVGLEGVGLAGQVGAALRFGLVHLVMLIPLSAALAIAIAGFCYGQVYRRAYRRAWAMAGGDHEVTGQWVSRSVQQEAAMASTVWHTTFNTLIAGLVVAALLAELTLT